MGPALKAESVIVERSPDRSIVRLLLVASDGTRMVAEIDNGKAIEIANEIYGSWMRPAATACDVRCELP